MSKLSISNVGPIKNGLGGDTFIEFDRLTILIGTQGSGKSTIAKVYSSLCWLEKALVRGDLTVEDVEKEDYFLTEVMSFQGISDYFSDRSNVRYIGEKCEFNLENKKFTVHMNHKNNYASPKIMYVPAERNFLTSIVRPDLISKLPRALHTFLAVYEEAKNYTRSKLVDLPIGKIKYKYDQKNNASLLVGEGFKTDLVNGSSGYQSFVPLHLVTTYLSDCIPREGKPKNKDYDAFLNVALQRRITEEIHKILADKSKKAPDSILKKIEQIKKRYIYSAFINIVEEPEQNLYPDSQRKVLFELLRALNSTGNNKLIITTHSPYILNFMTLSMQAYRLYHSGKKLPADKLEHLQSIVPAAAAITADSVRVYQLEEEGSIERLEFEYGFIPDNNKLNYKLEEINEQFSDLLDAGEE